MRVVSRRPVDEHLAYIRDELAALDAADATAILHPDLGDTPSPPFAIVLTPTICITITHHHLTADRVGVLHIAATGPWTLQGSDEHLEPPRVVRRLRMLEGWSHGREHIESVPG